MQHTDQKAADDAPEWALRLLTVDEFCSIVSQGRSTYYRNADAGIYPRPVRIGGSARIVGWQAWQSIKRLVAAEVA